MSKQHNLRGHFAKYLMLIISEEIKCSKHVYYNLPLSHWTTIPSAGHFTLE